MLIERSSPSARPAAARRPPAGAPPRLAPGIVPRPRLLRRLAGDVPVVLLVAPAGYGKTTLLAQWAARDGRPFTWLRPERVERGAARLLEDIAADGPAVVVLDDAQRASPATIRELADAACRLPPQTALALASRRRLGAPVARLRAHGLTLELDARELAMTGLEASLLLAAARLRLDAQAVELLTARTEGWPAALAVAAQALTGQARPEEAARSFGGTERVLADYLRSELLADLPAHRLAFLRRTSVAGELSPRLCEALIGRADAGRTLEALGLADIGLEPVDGIGSSFRLHPLVRELLQADLERLEPGLVIELHRRAAAWHGRNGRPEQALHHAIATGEPERAGRALWAIGAADAVVGRTDRLARGLAPFGPRELAAHPELAMSAAALHLVEGRREEATRWTAAADEAARRVARGPERTAALSLLRACAGATGPESMGTDAARAAALMPAAVIWQSLAALLQGVALHLLGEREQARGLLGRAVRPDPDGLTLVRALGHAQLSVLDAETGAWEDAMDHTRAARAAATGLAGTPPVVALVFTADAVTAAHRGDAADARRAADRARELLAREDGLPPWLAVEALVWLARAEIRLSDAAAARSLLARAARALPAAGDAPPLAAWLHEGWERADAFAAGATGELPALTNAELRVLRFLPSHLSFREIGDRLHVSANTVKTQALAAYRKLDVGSRSEAVARGRAVGLIDG